MRRKAFYISEKIRTSTFTSIRGEKNEVTIEAW